jgi:hypothetical protein
MYGVCIRNGANSVEEDELVEVFGMPLTREQHAALIQSSLKSPFLRLSEPSVAKGILHP